MIMNIEDIVTNTRNNNEISYLVQLTKRYKGDKIPRVGKDVKSTTGKLIQM